MATENIIMAMVKAGGNRQVCNPSCSWVNKVHLKSCFLLPKEGWTKLSLLLPSVMVLVQNICCPRTGLSLEGDGGELGLLKSELLNHL